MKQKWKFFKTFLVDSKGGFPVKCLQSFMEIFDCFIIDCAVSTVQYKTLFWSVQGPTPGKGVWPVPQTQETKALAAPGECNKLLFLFFSPQL